MKKTGLLMLLLLSGLAAACSSTNNSAPVPTPTPSLSTPVPEMTPVSAPIVAPSPARTVSSTNTVQNKDGSTTVVTTYSDGSKSEERSFKGGQLARVTRETAPSGASTARLTYRSDNREVEVKDESWVKRAMNATGDALATAGAKTKEGAIEAADKAEDVGDVTKKGVKKGAEVTKKGAVVAADKTGDAYDATKKGVKKGVEVTKKGAREVGDKAEDVGDAVKKGAKKVGSKIKDAVQ